MIKLDRFGASLNLHKLGFHELRLLKTTKEIAQTLNIKRNGMNNHVIFPFFSDTTSIVGCYEMNDLVTDKVKYSNLNNSAHGYVYPFCVPTFKTEKLDQSILYIVDSPLEVAQYASENKLSVAICYSNRVSDNLVKLVRKLRLKNPNLIVSIVTKKLNAKNISKLNM
jgi:hypothetical protein